MINAIAVEDLRWRGRLVFGTVVRGGLLMGIAGYGGPGEFLCPIANLEPEEREWVLVVLRDFYFTR